jgi:hypothetical protein
MRKVGSVILAAILLTIVAVAGNGRAGLAQDGDNIYFSGEIVGPDLVVTGAPYTATGIRENVQTLAGGNRIVHRAEQSVARDSMGRIRREETIDAIGPIALKGPTLIMITDPVLNRQILLDARTKTATVRSRKFFKLPSPEDSKAETANQEKSEKPQGEEQDNARERPQRRTGIDSRQSLGTKVLEGLNVKGQLNRWTIPTGKIGNTEPISVSVESWWSPDLQVEVMRHRIDPRFGDVKYTLTNVQRKEPDASLFRIPRGYRRLSAG